LETAAEASNRLSGCREKFENSDAHFKASSGDRRCELSKMDLASFAQ